MRTGRPKAALILTNEERTTRLLGPSLAVVAGLGAPRADHLSLRRGL
jgi:hypothetical protein